MREFSSQFLDNQPEIECNLEISFRFVSGFFVS